MVSRCLVIESIRKGGSSRPTRTVDLSKGCNRCAKWCHCHRRARVTVCAGGCTHNSYRQSRRSAPKGRCSTEPAAVHKGQADRVVTLSSRCRGARPSSFMRSPSSVMIPMDQTGRIRLGPFDWRAWAGGLMARRGKALGIRHHAAMMVLPCANSKPFEVPSGTSNGLTYGQSAGRRLANVQRNRHLRG
jgi:hypothetical protein